MFDSSNLPLPWGIRKIVWFSLLLVVFVCVLKYEGFLLCFNTKGQFLNLYLSINQNFTIYSFLYHELQSNFSMINRSMICFFYFVLKAYNINQRDKV